MPSSGFWTVSWRPYLSFHKKHKHTCCGISRSRQPHNPQLDTETGIPALIDNRLRTRLDQVDERVHSLNHHSSLKFEVRFRSTIPRCLWSYQLSSWPILRHGWTPTPLGSSSREACTLLPWCLQLTHCQSTTACLWPRTLQVSFARPR